MKIDINKRYRFRNGQPARILCADGPCMHMGEPQPVMSMDESGDVNSHFPTGRFRSALSDSDLDLVEIREPREWDVHAEPGTQNASWTPFSSSVPIRVREILD